MGYSCTAAAGDTLAYLEKTLQSPDTKSLVFRIGDSDYFFERGQEQADGAITGSLFKFTEHVSDALDNSPDARRAGSVRIAPDGKLVRFPGIRLNTRVTINLLVSGGNLPRGTAIGL